MHPVSNLYCYSDIYSNRQSGCHSYCHLDCKIILNTHLDPINHFLNMIIDIILGIRKIIEINIRY